MSTNLSTSRYLLPVFVGLLAFGAGLAARNGNGLPLLDYFLASQEAESDPHAGQDHDAHDDSHEGHDDASSLHLSQQARHNIGLTDDKLQPVKLGMFTRTLNIPARVVELPGRTKVHVVAPMTGVVAKVHVVQGEAVEPGTLLFKVRLTHEDLVQAQAAFLKTLGELDVEDREIVRLTKLDKSGVIAGKTLLARKYSKQKLQAVLNAHRESLLLHGLSQAQIDNIVSQRRLLRELEVRAPPLPDHSTLLTKESAQPSHLFVVQTVDVNSGAMIQTGDTLAVLADLDELYVEGRAFEHDADEITHVAQMQAADEAGWDITAVRENNGHGPEIVEGLKIVYVDNSVESDSRAQRFFVSLRNEIVQERQTAGGPRFLTWHFKPGQRMQLRVPVEQWKDRIVLPVDAVAQEGAETFVFLENGDHFDRRPVHVEYQDQLWVVIANDGSLFLGDTVALTGAHQMQVALKNAAGGGVDPHAGHSH